MTPEIRKISREDAAANILNIVMASALLLAFFAFVLWNIGQQSVSLIRTWPDHRLQHVGKVAGALGVLVPWIFIALRFTRHDDNARPR
jgi:hypothetical protein